MSKIANVANAVEVKVGKKESVFSEAFQKEYAERVGKVLNDLAPRIIETLETFGLITDNGYYYEHQAVTFEYNVLSGTLSVEIGANPVLRVNVYNEKVTVFRNGAWQRVFEQLYEKQMAGRDVSGIKRNKEVRIRDLMGMTKI